MEYISERIEKTRVSDSCDVFVAGGGVAGIAAALSAAREGSHVILAEKCCVLGGLASAGLITYYLPICDGCGKQVSFGLAEELLKLSVKHGAEEEIPECWINDAEVETRAKSGRYRARFNPQMFALLAEKILVENGVKILYDTRFCDTIGNEKIDYVVIENKSGRSAIAVKSVVDASGDGDICQFSDAETEIFGHNILAAWHYFYDGKKLDLKSMGAADNVGENEHTERLVDRDFTGVDGEEVSEFLLISHKQILDYVVEQKKENSNYVPATIATIPQLRMTRRIVGEYTLTLADEHKDFADSVGLFSNWRKSGPVYALPFSALYSKKVKNLITAGRCISCDDGMWEIARVIPVCAVSGEAAGLAASMSDDFAEIDIKVLQEKLKSRGVVLSEKDL
ncbi:MAG: FAD-dependent oxidoreductase [Ruminococcaceae bacterium]|nr:FAD-dependent oxidoreductase [Oscillospiraceae bacterium]